MATRRHVTYADAKSEVLDVLVPKPGEIYDYTYTITGGVGTHALVVQRVEKGIVHCYWYHYARQTDTWPLQLRKWWAVASAGRMVRLPSGSQGQPRYLRVSLHGSQ